MQRKEKEKRKKKKDRDLHLWDQDASQGRHSRYQDLKNCNY